MLANINFLQRKTKNSPAFKLIQNHLQQRQSHLTNTIYTQIRQQQTMKAEKDSTLGQQFDTIIEKKLTEEPGAALAKAFSRSKHKEQYEKKRKLMRYQSLSPKRSYQLETQASVGRKQRRIKSLLAEDTPNNHNRQLSRTQTLNSRPQTANPLRSTQLSFQQKKASLRQSTKINSHSKKHSHSHVSKRLSRSLSTLSGDRFNTISQQPSLTHLDYFNQMICQIRKSSKKFQQSLVPTQQQLQRVIKVNEKMQEHFGSLLLQAKEFPEIEFDDYSRMSKVDRYKFSSNFLLENLLSKNDHEVQEWISREKHKQLRIKGSAIVHMTKHVVSERQIKKLTANQKNQIMIQNDQKMNKFLQNPLQQINRIRLQRNIARQRIHSPNTKIKTQRSPQKNPQMSMSDYNKNFKEIKQYQKRKFMAKTAYQPKRKNFTFSTFENQSLSH